MTIAEAIKEMKKKKNKGRRISSEEATMYSQSRSNLMYWVLENDDQVDAFRLLKLIRDTNDWSFDEQVDK